MKLKKKILCGILAASVVCASAAFAADKANKEPIIKVGSQTVNESEFVELLSHTAGGNAMMAGLLLSQSTLKDRVEIAQHMSDSFVFAEAAKVSGLADREDIAFRLKWQYVQTLLEAYLQEMSAKWDMSEKALKKYYNGHKDEFVQAEAAHVYHILTADAEQAEKALAELKETKDFAKTAEKYSRAPNAAATEGELGWVEKGTAPGELSSFIELAEIGKPSSPIKTPMGFEIFEVTERRPAKQLSFKEAGEEIAQRLQMKYVKDELAALKKKYPVEINEKLLENISGVPAAPAAPAAKEKAEKEKEAK